MSIEHELADEIRLCWDSDSSEKRRLEKHVARVLIKTLAENKHPDFQDIRGKDAIERQAMIFVRALAIMATREQGYKSMFRKAGWRSALFDLRKKVERMWNEWWLPGKRQNVDSAIDAINFAGFFVQCVADRNESGTWEYGHIILDSERNSDVPDQESDHDGEG